MTERLMNRIVAAARDLECDVEPYPAYSGRGMYGRTTCAVTAASTKDFSAAVCAAAFNVAGEIGPRERDEMIEEIRGLAEDSLGRGIVVY